MIVMILSVYHLHRGWTNSSTSEWENFTSLTWLAGCLVIKQACNFDNWQKTITFVGPVNPATFVPKIIFVCANCKQILVLMISYHKHFQVESILFNCLCILSLPNQNGVHHPNLPQNLDFCSERQSKTGASGQRLKVKLLNPLSSVINATYQQNNNNKLFFNYKLLID